MLLLLLLKQSLAVLLDHLHAALAEQFGKKALHHFPSHQHVRYAAGHAQIIFENHELARRNTDQIGSGDCDVRVLADVEAADLAAEALAAIDYFPWDDAVIQGCDALLQAALDARPFVPREDAAQQIIGEDLFGASFPALNR